MTTQATLSDFRSHQSHFLDIVQSGEPVELLSRGQRRRAVVVSSEFFEEAIRLREDAEDVAAAAEARAEEGSITHEELLKELGLDIDG